MRPHMGAGRQIVPALRHLARCFYGGSRISGSLPLFVATAATEVAGALDREDLD